jgi:hypothetical protein
MIQIYTLKLFIKHYITNQFRTFCTTALADLPPLKKHLYLKILNIFGLDYLEQNQKVQIRILTSIFFLTFDKIGGSILIQQVVQFLISLKGLAIPNSLSTTKIIEMLCCAPNSDALAGGYSFVAYSPIGDKDFSCIWNRIDFEDFIELLCRAMSSDNWTFNSSGVAFNEKISPESSFRGLSSPSDESKELLTPVEETKSVINEYIPLHELLIERLVAFNSYYNFNG